MQPTWAKKRMVRAAQAGKAVLLVGMQKHIAPTRAPQGDPEGRDLGKIKAVQTDQRVKSQWDTANLNRFIPIFQGGVLFETGSIGSIGSYYWFGYRNGFITPTTGSTASEVKAP